MVWEYLNPVKVIFGEGALRRLPEYLGAKRILLVTDKNLVASGISSRVRDLLKETEVTLFDEVEPNPSSECVDRGGRLAADNKAEVIIGLGGGSSLDTAKAVSLVASYGAGIEEYLSGEKKVEKLRVPVVAIPTTSGTGSEVTPVAVITWKERNKKQPLGSNFLFPELALVDPELTYSMPPMVTASTGLDALSHGMEAYWSKNALPITDSLAISGVAKTLKYLKRAVVDGDDKVARREMTTASLLGGLAFALPKTAAIHACSFPLTHRFGIPHGTACSLTLVPFLRFNYPALKTKMDYLFQCCGFDSLDSFVGAVQRLQGETGLPVRLSEYGLKEEDIKTLVAESFHPNMQNNSREVTREALHGIYQSIF